MLLIHPAGKSYGGTLSDFIPLTVSMSIGVLAAQMRKNRYPAQIWDEELAQITPENIESIVTSLEKPYIFGISTLTAQASRSYELATLLKACFPDSTVILGGYHPTALPEEALSIPAVNYVVRGEGEITLIELYKYLREGSSSLESIRGISFRGPDGSIRHTAERALIADLDSLPDFPYHIYQDLLTDTSSRRKYDWGNIFTSRGCPYRCTYCTQRMMTGSTYRFKSNSRIIQELKFLIEQLNTNQIFFQDDNLLVNRKRIAELCNFIYDAGLHKKCTFTLQARSDNLYPEIMPLLKKANFKTIGVGMEVATDRLNLLIDKRLTVQQNIDAVQLAKKYGMNVDLYMIFGFPSETKQDRRAGYEIAKKLKPNLAKFTNILPYPGTPLYESVKDSNRLHIKGCWENFRSTIAEIGLVLGKKEPLPYVPDSCSEWELMRTIIRYNFLMILQPHSLKTLLLSKKNSGLLHFPPYWYVKPTIVLSLFALTTKLLLNFLFTLFPLCISEKVMHWLNPALKERLAEKSSNIFEPKRWTSVSLKKSLE